MVIFRRKNREEEMSFPQGIYYKEPAANAPEFVKGKISVNVMKFMDYLRTIKEEYVNLDIKISKEAKPYLQVDEWKRTEQPAIVDAAEPVRAKIIKDEDELPF